MGFCFLHVTDECCQHPSPQPWPQLRPCSGAPAPARPAQECHALLSPARRVGTHTKYRLFWPISFLLTLVTFELQLALTKINYQSNKLSVTMTGTPKQQAERPVIFCIVRVAVINVLCYVCMYVDLLLVFPILVLSSVCWVGVLI